MKTMMMELENALNSGEKVLWSEVPDAQSHAQAAMPKFWFGIPWTAFSVFWEVSAGWMCIAGHAPFVFSGLFLLWGIPFILVGIAMLLSPITAARAAQRTIYAITNQRALELCVSGKTQVLKSYLPNDIRDVESRRNGLVGTLMFAGDKGADGDTISRGFIGIRDIDTATQLLNSLRSKRASEW